MLDYYGYLVRTTWPALLVLFLLWLFALWRLKAAVQRTWRLERDAWGFLVLAAKLVIWIGVLAIYSRMFYLGNQDWFERPAAIQGQITEKEYDPGAGLYTLKVSDGSLTQNLAIDAGGFAVLQVGQRVSVRYLPRRREIIDCEVFTP